MDVSAFLRTCASEQLVVAIEQAIGRAEEARRPVHAALLADELLQDPSIVQRLSAPQRTGARAEMARELAARPDDGINVGTVSFDLGSLVDPALTLSKACGAETVSPLILLATLLSSGDLTDPQLIGVQEGLRRAGLTLEGLFPDPTQVARADFTFQSLGFGTDLTAMARAGRGQTARWSASTGSSCGSPAYSAVARIRWCWSGIRASASQR